MSTSAASGSVRHRVIVSGLLVVLCLFFGVAGLAYLSSLKEQPAVRTPEPRQYNVDVFVVQPADIQEMISAFGTAVAEKEVVVSAQVSGEIVEIYPQLKVGELVHAADVVTSGNGESLSTPGTTLVMIDPRSYTEKVIQTEGRIAEAKVELFRLDQEETNLQRLTDQLQKDLSDLEREYTKVSELVAKKIATDSDLRRAQLELRVIETKLVQNQNDVNLIPMRREQVVRRIATLQNDLQMTRLDQQRTTVRAPFNGRLTKVNVEQGQYVKVGDPLVSISDSSLVEIPLPISLDDYAKLIPFLRAGRMPVTDLAEHETSPARWQGVLVRAAPQADERTRTVMVYVQVDNQQQTTPLLPGVFVHARIAGPILRDVLAVPREAVLNSRGYVFEQNQAHRRDVEIGRTLHSLALITAGFQAGDRVVLSNLDVLYDGAPILLNQSRSLADELQQDSIPMARLVETQAP